MKRFFVVLVLLLMGTSALAAEEGGGTAINPKLNAYIKAYNLFIGTFGFTEQYRSYQRSNISRASVKSNFWVKDGWIGKGVDILYQAAPDMEPKNELNAAAAALLVSMKKVQEHLASLSIYYDSKKYLDDNLARGRAEDPVLLAEFKAAAGDLARFNVLLEEEVDRRDLAQLEVLKKEGQEEEYYLKTATFHAGRLLKVLKPGEDGSDTSVYARGDAEVAAIEKALEAARAVHNKDGSMVQLDVVAPVFNALTGSYRELKSSRSKAGSRDFAVKVSGMVNSYNMAVQLLNGLNGTGPF
ncbi:MAG: YiiG family protein [Alphaproteobacteria bacterium]|nr:YiiG family protein [Alphaproteobacteria bacterium]